MKGGAVGEGGGRDDRSTGMDDEGVRGGANRVRADRSVMRMGLVPMMEQSG